MATKKAGGAPVSPQGNEFVYYVPKPAAPSSTGTSPPPGLSAAASPAKPLPTLTVPAGGGKATFQSPKHFIQTNFALTSNASFGTKASLGGAHHVIRNVDIVRAALEGGYGRRSNWSTSLVLNKTEAVDLARYLAQRLQMVAACIERDANKAQRLRSFYKRVEASEKTALSFILGGMGAYLAAQQWLAAGGDRIRSFLHVGIFTKGIASATAAVTFNTGSKKVPDYLVEGHSGDWHVFESKGGWVNGRWARLCQGLAQLAHVPKIGWAGKATKNALTCVCVHTSVDPGKVLRVIAVDPPPDDNHASGRPPLELIEGVCRLLLMLETLEQYRALADGPAEEGLVIRSFNWQVARSSSFGEMLVGVPARYLQREDEVRQRLAVFLAISEVLAELKSPEAALNSLVQPVMHRLAQAAPPDVPVQNWTFRVVEVLARLEPQAHAEDFLYRCAQELQLNALAAELMPAFEEDVERLLISISLGGEYAVTSGGMYVQVRTGRDSSSEG